MRVLMVHDIGRADGGAEVLLTRTIEALRSRGHDVLVLTSDSPVPESGFADATFHAADNTQFGKFCHYLHNFDAVRTLGRMLDEFKPDVVHLHTVTKASPGVLRLLGRRHVPAVMTLHDYGLLYPRMHKALPRDVFCGLGDEACCAEHAGAGRYYFELIRTGLHLRYRHAIRTFIAPSHFVAGVAKAQGLEPVEVLPNPGPDAIPAPSKPDAARIVYSGRLEPEKGVLELLQSFELVRQKVPEAELVVAGGGSLLKELHRRKLPGVTVTGHIPAADVEKYYQHATVLAVPSLWPEPFGLIGPEAMRYGVPVVASGTGGMREWALEGQTALIADPRDAAAFADALTRLITHTELRKHLSVQALAKVQDFSLARYIKRLEQIYERARHVV